MNINYNRNDRNEQKADGCISIRKEKYRGT